MRRRLLPLLAGILLTAVPATPREAPLSPEQAQQIAELARTAFRTSSAPERRRALDSLREMPPPPEKQQADLIKLCLELAREGPKGQEGAKRELQSGPVRGHYLVSGSGRGKKGLFIGLHGGGPGAGDAATAQQKWSSATSKGLIGVFPQATRLVHDAWNQPDQEKFVLAIIEELKRTVPIDTNRIYLAGHSMGGFGTWSIGGHHADLFAAISPNSGGPYGQREMGSAKLSVQRGVLPNLCRLPVKWFHSADDPQCPVENGLIAEEILTELHEQHPDGYEFEFQKVDGIGHGIVREGLGPTIAWMTKRKRDPWPKKVVWEPWLTDKHDFYWIHLPSVSRGVRVTAEVEKKRRIVIETTGFVPRLSLLLSDEIIDTGREIEVVWNGQEKFRGEIAPSASAVVESLLAARDPERIATHRIDLE